VGAVQSALGVGGHGREKNVLATCLLRLAKTGSVATLSQLVKSKSEDSQRGRAIITGFICAVRSGKSLGATAKYLRRTASGTASYGLVTTNKYLRGAAGIALGIAVKYLRGAAIICPGATIKYLRR
jgi:hypothetical protein